MSQFEQMKLAVWDYMVGYYSRVRPRSYCDGLSLNEAEKRFWLGAKQLAKFT